MGTPHFGHPLRKNQDCSCNSHELFPTHNNVWQKKPQRYLYTLCRALRATGDQENFGPFERKASLWFTFVARQENNFNALLFPSMHCRSGESCCNDRVFLFFVTDSA